MLWKMCIARFMISVFHICMSLWLFCHSGLKPSYIGGVRHLWERGEEPWVSSEAAASGHGSEEPWASSEAAASGHAWITGVKNPGPHLRQLPQAMAMQKFGQAKTYCWTMYAAVITSSSSFHACVLHFVLDMASLWYEWVWVQCPKCKVWIETLAPLNPDDVVQETRYCGKCTIWWYDMHNRVWWPATRAYIVMLARCSVQDNPNAVL